MADMTQGISGLDDIAAKLQSGAAGSDPTTLGIGSLFGNMSVTVICVNLLAGLIGSAYLHVWQKKLQHQGRMLGSGSLCCTVLHQQHTSAYRIMLGNGSRALYHLITADIRR